MSNNKNGKMRVRELEKIIIRSELLQQLPQLQLQATTAVSMPKEGGKA